ncbi:hypothetical protein SAMN05192534_12434 [Alteribacillus persepolensis]|uniref:Uncharacterized protein n=1 Tax=Alteribacillus persepolensis TaxID=568899 RepID=A0A1G8IIK4_9BACI|nr:hypothetical protein [Alteribacillus persepolensis]SDI18662.1 hypothetical protein SAMN05192534_12434 [Alteribacillus persepolensis]
MPTCKGCGASIQWIKTPKGKAMPADTQEQTVVTKHGDVVKGFTPHWATCSQARTFKK